MTASMIASSRRRQKDADSTPSVSRSWGATHTQQPNASWGTPRLEGKDGHRRHAWLVLTVGVSHHGRRCGDPPATRLHQLLTRMDRAPRRHAIIHHENALAIESLASQAQPLFLPRP